MKLKSWLSRIQSSEFVKWIGVIEFILNCLTNVRDNYNIEKKIELVMIAQKEIDKCFDLIEEYIVRNRMENAFTSLQMKNGK